MGHLRAFGAFWYDFLVGDRWELFVGPIVALVVAAALVRADVPAGIVGAALFALVVAVAGVSLGLTLLRQR